MPAAVTFAPGQPAAVVDQSLRQSLAARDQARECAVLPFAEIMQRRLGGTSDAANLITLCSACHRLHHRRA